MRGATHAPDIALLLDIGLTCSSHDRGYAIYDDGAPRLLAATDEDAARELLNAVFARASEARTVRWITGRQQWAIETCLQAGLQLSTASGALFVGGDVGPFTSLPAERGLPVIRPLTEADVDAVLPLLMRRVPSSTTRAPTSLGAPARTPRWDNFRLPTGSSVLARALGRRSSCPQPAMARLVSSGLGAQALVRGRCS